jgi:hypothetical protein
MTRGDKSNMTCLSDIFIFEIYSSFVMYFIKTLVNLQQTYIALVDDGYYVNMHTTH